MRLKKPTSGYFLNVNKESEKNTFAGYLSLKIIAAVTIFIIFFLILLPGVSYHMPLLLFFVSFGVISILFPDLGLLFIAFASSYSGLIRWKDHSDPLLAGFNTIILTIYFWAVLINFTYVKKKVAFPHKFSSNQWLIILFYCMLILIITINIFVNWQGTIIFLFMAREYLLPLILLVFAIYAINNDYRNANLVLQGLFSGAAIVAGINIIHYYYSLPLIEEQYVMVHGSDSIYYSRLFLGYELPRMQHILGLSQPGAGSVFYTTCAFLGFYLLKRKKDIIERSMILFGILLLFIASAMTLSYSMILTSIGLLAYIYITKGNIKLMNKLVLFTGLTIFISGALFSNIIEVSQRLTLWQYIYMIISKRTYSVITNLSSQDIFFGAGLRLKSGGMFGIADLPGSEFHRLVVDNWILVGLYQLGIFFFFIMIALFLFTYLLLYKLLKGNFLSLSDRETIFMAGIVLVGFLFYAHGAMVIERLFSTPYVISLAILISTSNDRKQKETKGQNFKLP